MTIKGTLETFNLRELMQMLAFNQKVGTLVLETERGPRTIYMDHGKAAFMDSDTEVSEGLLRLLRRRRTVDPDRLARAYEIHQRSGRFLGDVVLEMGLFDKETRRTSYEEAVAERLFDAQLTAIHRFEFVDSEAVGPDGKPGTPIEPALPVEGLLLDLTRKMDTWQAISQVVPTIHEIFEGTGVSVDLADQEGVELDAAEITVANIDGFKTLHQIATTTDVDLYGVVQVAAALFQGGAIRPVPTEILLARSEDLLTRGEAAAAVPVLRRGIDRGDAPPETRLRLADALEASGDPMGAAAELDTFAALSDDSQVTAVFEALYRAHVLRGDDVAASARLCDYYLRHQPWLREYRKDALQALNRLVGSATAAGDPLEAAHRLAGFIERGDAPGEDLLVLADLYASGGQNEDAATALCRRAEDLLAADRTAPARDLLRRALKLDRTRSDARRRLMELDGAHTRRHQRKRIVLVFLLLGLLVVGAGSAWWTYSRQAGRAVTGAREKAETALEQAESDGKALIDAFLAHVASVETAAEEPADLAQVAEDLKAQVQETMQGLHPALSAYAAELESYSASGHEDTHRIILRGLEHRQQSMMSHAHAAVAELRTRCADALAEGKKANIEGRFLAARTLLRRARNLAIETPTVREEARGLLKHVDGYHARAETYAARIQKARDAGDMKGAFHAGVEALVELFDSDLTREIRFPVRVESVPEGAFVVVGNTVTEWRTPCVIEYSPFDKSTRLSLRLPGRRHATMVLPTYEDIERDTSGILAWEPRFAAELPVGPRWIIEPESGGFRALWSVGSVPVVLAADGRTIHGVDAVAGQLLTGSNATDGAGLLRMAGVLPGDMAWRILGHRTLVVQPREALAWEVQALGRLERRPLLVGGLVVVVDELGTLYGLDAQTGAQRWRRELDGPPSQAPMWSDLGILVATQHGAAYRVDPETGSREALGPAARGTALALPLGKSALFLGGGAGGCRRVGANGRIEVLGDASPVPGHRPVSTRAGVAWIDTDGVRWLAADEGAELTRVSALGNQPVVLASAGGELYAVDANGVLRAATADAPERMLWSVPLSGAPRSSPLPLGDAVFILVGESLVAVER